MKWLSANKIDGKYLLIKWTYKHLMIDLLPGKWFGDERDGRLVSHQCYDPWIKMTTRPCYAWLTVKGAKATLDYCSKAAAKRNKYLKRGGDTLPGTTVIHFSDKRRDAVREVWWIDDRGTTVKKAAETSWPVIDDPKRAWIFPSSGRSPRTMSLRKRRRLQVKFGRELATIYRNTCAVTGCMVPNVLQAAHLYPASSESSYDARNGILLRSDIHALLDCGLLRINPHDRTVSLNPKLMNDHEYRKLNGKKIRAAVPESLSPDLKALRYFWDKFKQVI